MELRLTEVNHEESANDCVAEALKLGFATVEPEPGLLYVALTSRDSGDRLAGLFSPTIQPYVLAPSPDWLPAHPFTLSLNPDNLVQFLLGHVTVLVLIDLALLKALFAQHRVYATMMMDGTHSVQVCKDPDDLYKGVFRVSEQRFGRIAGEFQSLAWFAEETARSIDEVVPAVMTAEDLEAIKAEPKGCWEIPPDWHTVRDCFDV